MGNLNKFYLMGRVSRAPEPAGEGPQQVVTLAITPGTGQRGPRGGPVEPILLEAGGAQAASALELRVGQGVFVRGQLRQERRGETSVLVGRIQALELLAEPRRRPPRPRPEGGEAATGSGSGEVEGGASGRRRRRRRGRGRGPREERPAGAAPAGAAPAGAPPPGAAPAAEGAPAPSKPALPPPEPVAPPAPAQPVQPPPDPTLENDMPF